MRGKNRTTRSRVKNQQTPPVTYDGGSGNRTRVTLVENSALTTASASSIICKISPSHAKANHKVHNIHMTNTRHASKINSGYSWGMPRNKKKKQLFAAFNKYIFNLLFIYLMFLYENLDKLKSEINSSAGLNLKALFNSSRT